MERATAKHFPTLIFFVMKENRYSISPLLSIAETYTGDIGLIPLPPSFSRLIDGDALDRKISEFLDSHHERFSKNPSCIFFSFTSWLRYPMLSLAAAMRKRYPNNFLVAGGPDSSGAFKNVSLFFDIICRGEGELFMYSLLESFAGGKDAESTAVPNAVSVFSHIGWDAHGESFIRRGCAVERGDEQTTLRIAPFESGFVTGATRFEKERIGLRERLAVFHGGTGLSKADHSLDPFAFMPAFPKAHRFCHPVELVRGCATGCYFCQTSYIFGSRCRSKPVELVENGMEMLINAQRFHIRFIAPNFFAYGSPDGIAPDYSLLADIYDYAAGRSESAKLYFGSFPSEIHPSSLNGESVDFIRKYGANSQITVGLQTASERLLGTIGRPTDVMRLEDVIPYAGRFFDTIIDIMFGLPGETGADRETTLSFLERNLKGRVTANIHFFLPLPGTPFAKKEPVTLSREELRAIELLFSKGLAQGNFRRQSAEFKRRTAFPKT